MQEWIHNLLYSMNAMGVIVSFKYLANTARIHSKSNFPPREQLLVSIHGKNSQQYGAFSAVLAGYTHLVRAEPLNAEGMNSWYQIHN